MTIALHFLTECDLDLINSYMSTVVIVCSIVCFLTGMRPWPHSDLSLTLSQGHISCIYFIHVHSGQWSRLPSMVVTLTSHWHFLRSNNHQKQKSIGLQLHSLFFSCYVSALIWNICMKKNPHELILFYAPAGLP